MVPNQEFDIASKKLFAALATGDLLLFLVAVDEVIEVFDECKFEAVKVLAEVLSRPRWEWLLVTGNRENLEQFGAKIITLCSDWWSKWPFSPELFCFDTDGIEAFIEDNRANLEKRIE